MSTTSFKSYFDVSMVEQLCETFTASASGFDATLFSEHATDGLDDKEMMDRVRQIADAMALALPGSTAERMATLVASMPPLLADAEGSIENGYRFWPYGEFIANYGLDDVDASFEAMIELTMRFSSEFAVRPFLANDVEDTLDRLEALVDHDNVHVRRWVSEGTRSRLPWAKRIPALHDVQPRRIALLSALRHDPERYVQRSVANHLQDILKDDEAAGLEVLRAWASEEDPGVQWIVKHASRGLLKAGHPEVMELFGYQPDRLEIVDFEVTPRKVRIGDAIELSVRLENTSDAPALTRVDFALLSVTKTGQISRKVFRWSDCTVEVGESEDLQKSYQFVHRSTRRVYPGEHRLEVIVNGVVSESIPVEVTT